MVICEASEICIRSLEKTVNDMNLMYKWLSNPNVYRFYGGEKERALETVRKKYLPRIDSTKITPCIIECNKVPIGYIQFYLADAEIYGVTQDLWASIAKPDEKAAAVDIFIGEDNYRNIGIGTKSIILICRHLIKYLHFDFVLVDPKTDNTRAIRVYKKCGFRECFTVKNREEECGIKYDNLIMKLTDMA